LFREFKLEGARAPVAARIAREIASRLEFLVNVGLDYLSLDRPAGTLSGGEAQRIRLASQIGSGLTGVLYVLDEPSIGLHQRDNARLIQTLQHLRDLGNTVVVVEHDEEAIRAADHVVDMGPGAGEAGGCVVAEGPPQAIVGAEQSLTGRYLSGALRIEIPRRRNRPREARLVVRGASGNNLKNVTFTVPAGLFVCVTGVSGSGKSTLVNDTMHAAVARHLHAASTEPAPHDSIAGLEHFDKVVNVDQSPIGRTPRSNPATYTGLFAPIRELFAGVPEARERGYGAGRFSFNVKGGRCEACQGDGLIKVEMHFLPDMYVACDVCRGRRYNRETLEIRYKGEASTMCCRCGSAKPKRSSPRCRQSRAGCARSWKSASDTCSSGNRRSPARAAKRSASSFRSSSHGAIPERPCTSSTSRPPACTSTTSSCCSKCCSACATRATRWW
jgi:excinuclease ABC subunit A